MDEEIMGRIEKQMEGSNLALTAVAEVLHKMDARLSKEDNDDEDRRAEEEEKVEKAELVKSIASEVFEMIKADQGLDVDGSKVRTGTKMNGSEDDHAVQVDASRPIGDVQATIQAMQKEEEERPKEDEREDEEEHPAEERMGYKSEEYQNMAKQLEDLQKQLANYQVDMQKQVQDEAENRLQKMGFREEGGTIAPKMMSMENLGTDGTEPIVKSVQSDDVVDQLTNLSYGELRSLQTRIQAGDTEGIPTELL